MGDYCNLSTISFFVSFWSTHELNSFFVYECFWGVSKQLSAGRYSTLVRRFSSGQAAGWAERTNWTTPDHTVVQYIHSCCVFLVFPISTIFVKRFCLWRPWTPRPWTTWCTLQRRLFPFPVLKISPHLVSRTWEIGKFVSWFIQTVFYFIQSVMTYSLQWLLVPLYTDSVAHLSGNSPLVVWALFVFERPTLCTPSDRDQGIVGPGLAPSPVLFDRFQTMDVRCLSCGQGPDDFEKDLFPDQEIRVHWERRGKDSQGLLHFERELFELLGLWLWRFLQLYIVYNIH